MDSVNLLVVDRTPEPAEHINSLLRNSGIKIHVIHVKTFADVNRAFDSHSPILVVYANPDPVDAGFEEITEIADGFSVPCALYCDLDDTERLVSLLRTAPCYVIDAGNESQLISTVSGLLETQGKLKHSRAQSERLEELDQRYELLLESARDAIAYIHEGLHVYANRAYLELLRMEDAEALQGISLLEIMTLAGDGDFKSVLRDLTKGQFPGEGIEVKVSRPDGSSFEASLAFSAATFNGESCIQMMLQEQDQTTELAAELDRLRITDPLTQLANRPRFTAVLTDYLQQNNPSGAGAVLYLEPDALNEDQEEVGMGAVDAHVVELSRVVRKLAEEGDQCGRISDHGIAILASRENKQQLEAFAQAIKGAFKNVIVEAEGRSHSASCSIGIVTLSRLNTDAHGVISQARKACAEAATEGDSLVVYRPQLTAVATAEEDSAWVERIRYALKNEDFRTVHQSIVDLDGEGEHLIENLIYLRGEESEYQLSDFGKVADKHDLAGAIDRCVIPGILKSVADNEESQILPISTHSVADPGFAGWLLDNVKLYAVDAKKLIIQVTADCAQANLKPTQRLMKGLGSVGCRLSISSFDSERRTLQLFEHLDAHYVKLHTALTAELQGNSKAQEDISQVVDAAGERHAIVIADEIADTSNLAILWQCGVKMIAGTFLKETPQVVAQ